MQPSLPGCSWPGRRAALGRTDHDHEAAGPYGQARLKVSDADGFDAIDHAIGQASQALPGRKDGKSVQDELAEKARQVAEFAAKPSM